MKLSDFTELDRLTILYSIKSGLPFIKVSQRPGFDGRRLLYGTGCMPGDLTTEPHSYIIDARELEQ